MAGIRSEELGQDCSDEVDPCSLGCSCFSTCKRHEKKQEDREAEGRKAVMQLSDDHEEEQIGKQIGFLNPASWRMTGERAREQGTGAPVGSRQVGFQISRPRRRPKRTCIIWMARPVPVPVTCSARAACAAASCFTCPRRGNDLQRRQSLVRRGMQSIIQR